MLRFQHLATNGSFVSEFMPPDSPYSYVSLNRQTFFITRVTRSTIKCHPTSLGWLASIQKVAVMLAGETKGKVHYPETAGLA